MKNIVIVLNVLLAVGLLTISTQNVMASTTTDENGFNQGYNSGLAQGGIDRQAHIFHIGSICIGQTLAWCVGYTDGYLDGFFAVLPSMSSTHTTTTIIVHRDHHNDRGCHDNMTCGDMKKPDCKMMNDCKVPDKVTTPSSMPSTPSTPSSGQSSGSTSSGSSDSGSSSSSNSGSPSSGSSNGGGNTSQPTIKS